VAHEQAKIQHAEAVEANRALGVIEYKSGERQSDEVWEVTDGLKYLPGEERKSQVLAPGMRFRPTVEQVRQTRAGRGGLRGKARELTTSEYASLRRDGRTVMATGADIGLRGLSMEKDALALALEHHLSEADFDAVKPGRFGRYTIEQVESMVAERG
jgi:hypothetical protein